jgi:hypothetical protein
MNYKSLFLLGTPEKIRTSNRLIRRDVAGYFIEPLGHLFGKLDRPTQRVFITNPNYRQWYLTEKKIRKLSKVVTK